MFERIIFIFFCGFLAACAMKRPDIRPMEPPDHPIPVELNVDFFCDRGRAQRCMDDDDYKKSVTRFAASGLFERVTSEEERLLRPNQLVARIDNSTKVEDVFFTPFYDFTLRIRWQIWNLNGKVLEVEKEYAYRSRFRVHGDEFISWQMDTAEEVYRQLRYTPKLLNKKVP